MSHFRFSDMIKLIVLLWIIIFYKKRRIIKTIDLWLQQMCREDKSNLFYVCRTFWIFEKGIYKAFRPTLLTKQMKSNVTPRSGSECSLSFTDKLVAATYIPEDISFPFFSPSFLTALWLIILLDPFPFWKGLQLQGSDYNWPWLTLSLHHCVPAAIITYI